MVPETKQNCLETEICPVCLDPIDPHSFPTHTFCCGRPLCYDCHKSIDSRAKGAMKDLNSYSSKCPMCRAPLPSSCDGRFKMAQVKAKETKKPWAYYNLGWCYTLGIGTATYTGNAIEFFEKAAEDGHVRAQMMVARKYIAEGKSNKAIKWLELASTGGHAEASFRLANILMDGKFGVAKDVPRAVALMTKSAETGYILAQCNLGCWYAEGRGVPRSLLSFEYWMKEAAKNGNVTAMYALAFYYRNGKHDLPQALFWARRCVSLWKNKKASY